MANQTPLAESTSKRQLIPVAEVAEILSLSVFTVYKFCDDGTLDGVYQGTGKLKRRYVRAESLQRYLDSLSNTPN